MLVGWLVVCEWNVGTWYVLFSSANHSHFGYPFNGVRCVGFYLARRGRRIKSHYEKFACLVFDPRMEVKSITLKRSVSAADEKENVRW